jgi:hypothetical protein
MLASRVLIDREELKTAARTLERIFNIVLERVEVLDGKSTKQYVNKENMSCNSPSFAAIFRQKYVSAEPGNNLLDRFAFSMVKPSMTLVRE